MTSSAQVGDRYVGGPTRNLICCPGCWRRIVRQNSTASLDLWRTSSNTKSKKSGTQSNAASATPFGRLHVNSTASQNAGAQRLHGFVAIEDEHVFRAHLRINRRLLGHRTPPSLLGAGVSESSAAFEKRASPERSKPRLLSLSPGGGDWSPPKRTRKPVCFRLLREQRFFARSSWPPQSFERQGYRRPLSPAPSALLDSFRGDRLPRLLSCPKD